MFPTAPPKTPDEVVKKIHAVTAKVLNAPEVKERLREIKAELDKMKTIVTKQGIKLEGV